jgi:hypothetical protein
MDSHEYGFNSPWCKCAFNATCFADSTNLSAISKQLLLALKKKQNVDKKH